MAVIDHRPARIDVLHRAGDSFRLGLSIEDDDGTAVDISTWTLEAQAAPAEGAAFAMSIELQTDGTDGRFNVDAGATAMAAITWAGHWSVTRTDTDTTLAAGRITVESDPA